MAKITINDILASFAGTTAINDRFQQVEDELNNNVLYRNPGAEPNAMGADLDMDGNNILNAVIDTSNQFNADTLELQAGAYYLARANHTGTQLLTTISDVTASASEVNTLDGIPATLTATELGYLDGATAGVVLTTGDEGTGNGLDADTVDAQHAADLLARANHTGTQAVSTLTSVTASATEINKLTGANGGNVTTEFDDWHLGGFASAPTLANDGSALREGMIYFNTGTNLTSSYDGTVWNSLTAAAASNAVDVVHADAAAQYLGSADVEDSFTKLGSVAGGLIVGFTDANYSATKLSGALTELASTAGAGIIGILDGSSNFPVATEIETALEDLAEPPTFSAYQIGTGVSAGTIPYDTELWDSNSTFDIATGKYTAIGSHHMSFTASAGINVTATGFCLIGIYKNGILYREAKIPVTLNDQITVEITTLMQVTGVDVIDARITFNGGATGVTVSSAPRSFFEGHVVRRSHA